jgi:hypothetical protein
MMNQLPLTLPLLVLLLLGLAQLASAHHLIALAIRSVTGLLHHLITALKRRR